MDEIRRSDLDQLPGIEAIEHPEKEIAAVEEAKKFSSIDESDIYQITHRDLNKLLGEEIYPDDNKIELMTMKDISDFYIKSPMDKSRYKLKFNQRTNEALLDDKKATTTVTCEKNEMDKFLNNKDSIDLLKFYGLKLPSKYKGKSLEEFQKAFDKGLSIAANYKKSIKEVVIYKKDSLSGLLLAYPKAGENSREKTKELISEYNIMQFFINNMRELRNYKKLTGTGIIHFNNPLQLLDRLELLIGSLLAGNNGVIQEFSQIAHLLHQMKVITKKQLNDLFKKYILNK